MFRTALLLVSLSAASLHAQTTPTPPIGDGRITGRVLTTAGDPIPGAEVIAPYFTTNPQAEFIFRAVAGADGSFVLDRIPAGRIRLVARKAGYSGMTTNPAALSDGVLIDVKAGDVASGIDLVLRPTGAISGRVRRPDGTPVAQARVSVQLRRPNGQLIGVQPPFKTGSDGAFTLRDVPQGSYVVVARYSAKHEMIGAREPAEYQDWTDTFYPSASDFDAATRIDIRGGDTHDSIDITLRPEPRFSISGVVVDAKGAVATNVRVEYGNGSSSGVATIGNAGRFELRGIANGRVHLLTSSDSPAGPLVAYSTVDVQGASLHDVRVEVGPAASVRGRVIVESGTLSLAGAQVVLSTLWFRPPQIGSAVASRREPDSFDVASDGTFAAAPLIGDRVVQVVGLPANWQLREIRRRGAVVSEGRLTLANGQVIDDLEVIVSPRN